MGRGSPLPIALQHACFAGFQQGAFGSAKAACQLESKEDATWCFPALIQPYAQSVSLQA
jgi:hypothetical protein